MRIFMQINKVVRRMIADSKIFDEAEINDMVYEEFNFFLTGVPKNILPGLSCNII